MTRDYPSDWNSRRKKVYRRDNHTCQNCGASGESVELHAHHIVPKSKGGSHELSNLKALCSECHKAIHGDSMAPTAKRRSSRTNRSSGSSRSSQTSGLLQLTDSVIEATSAKNKAELEEKAKEKPFSQFFELIAANWSARVEDKTKKAFSQFVKRTGILIIAIIVSALVILVNQQAGGAMLFGSVTIFLFDRARESFSIAYDWNIKTRSEHFSTNKLLHGLYSFLLSIATFYFLVLFLSVVFP